jgi:hypothetical protein
VIAVYIVTKKMTLEQHTKGRDRLREAGAPESAMKLHSCFGEDGQLQVFDVWESQEAFDESHWVWWRLHRLERMEECHRTRGPRSGTRLS